jgi:hypothetical protein
MILKLPNTIINLRKLQYIYAGNETDSYESFYKDMAKLLQKKIFFLTLFSVAFCAFCCAPRIMDEDGTANRRDVCTGFCCSTFPIVFRELTEYGVALPRGLRKLRALHTLSTINIAVEKHILKDIKSLTQLRRLGVTGINKKNYQEFCSTLDDLSNLESLKVHSAGEPGLCGCLDGVSSPPKNLQSLKLASNLVELPEWIAGLHNLVKLKLEKTKLSELDATIRVLGKLPNLAILRLLEDSLEGEDLRLTFHREAFSSLMVLVLECILGLKSVEFAKEATPKLELLRFVGYPRRTSAVMFSGLASLPRLKEFTMDNDDYNEDFLKDVPDQLDGNLNAPVLKRC